MANWSDTYLYALTTGHPGDSTIVTQAQRIESYQDIPGTNRFAQSSSLNWLDPANGGMATITGKDKLIIIAHGSGGTISYAFISPIQLVDDLYTCGLRNVGLLTFKACSLASKTFLEDFRDACKGKINVGYIKGYYLPVMLGEKGLSSKPTFKRKKRSSDEKAKIIVGNAPFFTPAKDVFQQTLAKAMAKAGQQ